MSAATVTLELVGLKEDWHMAHRAELREWAHTRARKPGQVVFAFNTAYTRLRIVDHVGDVTDRYAPEGQVWNTTDISQRLRETTGVRITVPASWLRKINRTAEERAAEEASDEDAA